MKNLVCDNTFFSMACTSLEKEVKKLRVALDDKADECDELRQLAEELKCISVTQPIEHDIKMKQLTEQLENLKVRERQALFDFKSRLADKDKEINELTFELRNQIHLVQQLRNTISEMEQQVHLNI